MTRIIIGEYYHGQIIDYEEFHSAELAEVIIRTLNDNGPIDSFPAEITQGHEHTCFDLSESLSELIASNIIEEADDFSDDELEFLSVIDRNYFDVIIIEGYNG